MRLFVLLTTLLAMAGCTWETYQNQNGHTALRPKYENGTRVSYEDGTYANDQRYNNLRPVPHPVTPGKPAAKPVPRTHWQ